MYTREEIWMETSVSEVDAVFYVGCPVGETETSKTTYLNGAGTKGFPCVDACRGML